MKKNIIRAIILLCIVSGCNQGTKSNNRTLDFLGEWILNDDSLSILSRGCISLDISDSIAKFKIIKHKNNYLVKLNSETNISWQSSLAKKYINSSQIINTSEIGRFCGERTEVNLKLKTRF